ncbi:MAG TPA: hypothetical protein VOB72_19825, partial [Candidatus Dormibacteraeota bacterium]|nr:hypothetical protein [Candidatus Dormibacteraeota bacterium]
MRARWRRTLLSIVVAVAANGVAIAGGAAVARADDARCDDGPLTISLVGSCPSTPAGHGGIVNVHIGVTLPPAADVDVTLCLGRRVERHDDDCRKPPPTPTPPPPTPVPTPSVPAPAPAPMRPPPPPVVALAAPGPNPAAPAAAAAVQPLP